jgi:hypothetical protein
LEPACTHPRVAKKPAVCGFLGGNRPVLDPSEVRALLDSIAIAAAFSSVPPFLSRP